MRIRVATFAFLILGFFLLSGAGGPGTSYGGEKFKWVQSLSGCVSLFDYLRSNTKASPEAQGLAGALDMCGHLIRAID